MVCDYVTLLVSLARLPDELGFVNTLEELWADDCGLSG